MAFIVKVRHGVKTCLLGVMCEKVRLGNLLGPVLSVVLSYIQKLADLQVEQVEPNLAASCASIIKRLC